MLPVIAYCVLESVGLLGRAAALLGEKAIAGFTVNEERLDALARRNAILATVLAPRIGYDAAAELVKRSALENRSIEELARETTGIDADELHRLLDPRLITGPGIDR